jgi:hypothetical protein
LNLVAPISSNVFEVPAISPSCKGEYVATSIDCKDILHRARVRLCTVFAEDAFLCGCAKERG